MSSIESVKFLMSNPNMSVVVQVGRILKRDREKCRAMVQLDRYEERVFALDYDTICHYVGGTDH